MGDAVGEILALATGASLSPIPIIGVVLMLATPRGRGNGLAFLVGWVSGMIIVGSIVLLVLGSSAVPDASGFNSSSGVMSIVLGILLLEVARRQFAKRPADGEQVELPEWTRRVDGFDMSRAAALGFALSAINPKNLLLTVSAAALIAKSGISDSEEFAALAIYVLIATVGPAIPVVFALTRGDKADRQLDSMKLWLARNNATIFSVICFILAAKLIGDGVAALS